MRDALYVIARAPRPGFAKTRLGRSIGHERAIILYRAFLRDLAARFSASPFALAWYVTPPDAWPEISSLTGETGRVLFQGEGDLTWRQRELFREAASRGEERTVLIASDSPHLTVEIIEEAFRCLDRQDIVFGPTYDGGYYLIGMRGWHDVLQGMPMSMGTELEGIIARAQLSGLSVGLLEATFAVDVVEDIRHLRPLVLERPDLPATQDALESLGLLEQESQPANGERGTLARGEQV
ncbi:MAG: TIGR04282 family arsenosugar biosynthesis glycosyltransferase [Actinomycetota bacterium]|nr:TIGR04282 family arsenosugar biosynthesis glycosyltransferase [Actinomycetota bacterium]